MAVDAAANPEPRTSSAPVQRRSITAIIRPEYCRHRIYRGSAMDQVDLTGDGPASPAPRAARRS
eukprot:COSAG04_NODE_15922_length_515_cov_1.923077_1_plen_63_part_10